MERHGNGYRRNIADWNNSPNLTILLLDQPSHSLSCIVAANYVSSLEAMYLVKVERCQPCRALRYAEVNVLLLFWEEDDVGIASEIEDLGRHFRETLGYPTFPYKITSSSDPGIDFSIRVIQFIKSCGGKGSLIIVYYGGADLTNRAAYETIFSPIATTSALLEELKSPAFRFPKSVVFPSEGAQAASKLGIVYSLPQI
jgi:hypothetical protein